MVDVRLQRMAQVLVRYCVGAREGDRLAINSAPAAQALLLEVYREALRVGTHPELFLALPGQAEIYYQEASDEQLAYIPAARRLMIEDNEALIVIDAQENTKSLNGINPERFAIARKAGEELNLKVLQRTNERDPYAPGSLRWNRTLFPTDAYAQDAEMSLAEFENFVYHACFLDDDDPVARWQELSAQQERLVQWLHGRHTVHLRGQDTDLTLSIEGRTFINDDGHYNLPGGEFFTGPVEQSANGFIRYSFPCSFQGRSVEDVRLRFENGVVVEARAGQGQEYLDRMLAMDEGARRIGEFAFGNNRNVDRCTKHTLFDEKMGGTVHLALGASIPQTGGVNVSALHWDMVCDLRHGSEIRVDDELFSKDGRFVV
ncbi:MAG TPA: aminopeptidase [Ktedonobacteraceae bacterium]|nr:aminopeptidase [Ktedonobacteraceae bacterium]